MIKKQLYFLLTAVLMTYFSSMAWADANVAKVTTSGTDVYYTDFVTALAAWENNSTLTLLADVTHNAIIDLTSGTRTIDLNGHGIRHTGTQGIFCVVNGATLTLEDSDPTTTHKNDSNRRYITAHPSTEQ